MSVIDDFLARVDEPQRRELERIRSLARTIVPDAGETISYGIPTLTYRGSPFLGFQAWKAHVGLYPFSSEPITLLRDELQAYSVSRGAIRVPYDRPITKTLLRKIIACRLQAIRARSSR